MKKKNLSALFALTGLWLAPINAMDASIPNQFEEVGLIDFLSIEQVDENLLADLMAGKNPNLAIQIPQGTALPTHFFLKGNQIQVLNDDKPVLQIQVKQTLYVRYTESDLFFSTDLTTWTNLSKFINEFSQNQLKVGGPKGPSYLDQIVQRK